MRKNNFIKGEVKRMKKLGFLSCLLALAVFLCGCATVLPTGAFYTEVKLPVAAGDGGSYSKVGVSKATSLFGLIATGDASIESAAKDANIREIKYVDFEAKNILGFYGEYTTTVYGN